MFNACDKAHKTKADLIENVNRKHNPNVQSTICARELADRKGLKRHMKIKHGKDESSREAKYHINLNLTAIADDNKLCSSTLMWSAIQRFSLPSQIGILPGDDYDDRGDRENRPQL